MKPIDLLNRFGTKANIARFFDIHPVSVGEWFDRNIVPLGRQYEAELLTGGELKAARPKKRRKAA